MLYEVGTYIDLRKSKLVIEPAPEPADEPKHALYIPGTRIIFQRLNNFSGVLTKTIIPA